MRITAEISLYPLREEFLSPIQSFIRDLQESSALEITVNQMSTQLVGELHDVSQALEKALEMSFRTGGSQVLVAKFLNADLPLDVETRMAADNGSPIVVTKPNGAVASAFLELADRLISSDLFE